jgi:hypothetical protein
MAIEKKIVIDVDAVKAAGGLDKLKDSLKEVNKEVEETQESSSKALDGVGKNAKKSSKGVSGLSKGFKGLGVAMKAAGIGLVIAALAKLSDIFMKNQKVADLFNTAFEAVSIAFNDFVGFIVDNSGVVVDFFKNIFENPLESVKALGASIKANIVERFESFLDTLGYLASAVKKVFSGDFAGALEDVKNAGKESIDAITGVNNTFDKGVEFVEKNKDAVKGYITETIKAAKENVNLANAAELAAAQQSLLVEKYDIQAEQLRQIRDEERNSIEDRRKANDQLLEVLAEQEKAMLAQADAQLRSAQAELDKNASIENQVALTEALANKQGVLAQIEGFRSEQKANDLALDREEVELTNTKLESESTLSIERKRFNAEQIEDEVQRLEALKQIDLLEAEQEAIRLQAIVDNANAGTQAKVDAQIALDEFMEQSRQTNLTRDTEIADATNKLEENKKEVKISTLEAVSGALNGLSALAGENAEAQKGIGIAQAIIDTFVGADKALAQGGIAGPIAAAGIIATGLANVKTIASTKIPKAKGSSAGVSSGQSVSQPPSFNIVGATETSQLAEAVGSQTQQPVQAYVVANDVTTAQSLENNIVEGATL